MSVLKVETQCSIHEFADGMSKVRRTPGAGAPVLRGDGRWLACEDIFVAYGAPMTMTLHLSENPEIVTYRTTSPVIHIEEVPCDILVPESGVVPPMGSDLDEWHH